MFSVRTSCCPTSSERSAKTPFLRAPQLAPPLFAVGTVIFHLFESVTVFQERLKLHTWLKFCDKICIDWTFDYHLRMSDTTDSIEQMRLLPDGGEYDQRVEDDRDESPLMHNDSEEDEESGSDDDKPMPTTKSRKEESTEWYHDDVGITTANLSALLEKKGASVIPDLLYEEVLIVRVANEFDHKIRLHIVWEVLFNANMDTQSAADSRYSLSSSFRTRRCLVLTFSGLLTHVSLLIQALRKASKRVQR